MSKQYRMIMSEAQRKLIVTALWEYIMRNTSTKDAENLVKRLDSIPKSERAHTGIMHVLS